MGGAKSTQRSDIEKAKEILKQIKKKGNENFKI
jgi:putative component of toxin-antitoxin plasmid stabilization module